MPRIVIRCTGTAYYPPVTSRCWSSSFDPFDPMYGSYFGCVILDGPKIDCYLSYFVASGLSIYNGVLNLKCKKGTKNQYMENSASLDLGIGKAFSDLCSVIYNTQINLYVTDDSNRYLFLYAKSLISCSVQDVLQSQPGRYDQRCVDSDKGYDCSFSGSVLYANIANCIYSSYISNTSTFVDVFGAAGNWYQSSLSVLHTDNEKVARTELRLPSLYSSTADVSTGDFCDISLPVNMYDSQLNLSGGYSSGNRGTGNIIGCVVDIVKTGYPGSLFWVSCDTIQNTDITAVGSVN